MNWNDLWSNGEHIATIVGLSGAAVWAYFNFVKSRTYHPRMEMIVSGEIRSSDKRQYLIPRVTLKNIGRSKIGLIQEGSGFRIWVAAEPEKELREIQWIKGSPVLPMLEYHRWIEPCESIFEESRLIPLPSFCIAVKIEARLVAQVRRFPRKKNNEWNGSAVVGPVALSKGVSMGAHDDSDRLPDLEYTRRYRDDDKLLQKEEDKKRSKDWEDEKKSAE